MTRLKKMFASSMVVALAVFTSISAFAQGNPCPGGVCPPGGGNNDAYPISPGQYWPTNLIVYEAYHAFNHGTTLHYTNGGVVSVSGGKVVVGGNVLVNSRPATVSNTISYAVALNTSSNNVYRFQASTNPIGNWFNISADFVGSKTPGGKVYVAFTNNSAVQHFFRVEQLQDLVIWSVYGNPGSYNPCNQTATGYASFTLPNPYWGWSGIEGEDLIVTDPERTDTLVQWGNMILQTGCGSNVNGAEGWHYRFTLFSSNSAYNGQPVCLRLQGFEVKPFEL